MLGLNLREMLQRCRDNGEEYISSYAECRVEELENLSDLELEQRYEEIENEKIHNSIFGDIIPNQDFKDIDIKSAIEDVDVHNNISDDQIMTALGAISELSKDIDKNKSEMNLLRNYLRKFIEQGYNYYTLMRGIKVRLSEIKQANERNGGKSTVEFDEIKAKDQSIKLLESLEKDSAYKAFIETADRIGHYKLKQEEAQKVDDWDKVEKLDKYIETELKMLRRHFKNYDLNVVLGFMNGRRSYFATDPQKRKEFLGSREVARDIKNSAEFLKIKDQGATV